MFIGATNDTNTLIHYGWIWLTEGGLYSYWFQFNTPLAVMMYVPPALAMVHLHLTEGMALHLWTVALCACSLGVTWHALKDRLEKNTRILWVSACAVTLLVVPESIYVFSDREHLLFIFALPWMIQMLLGLSPLPYTAVLASLGFLLKPYDLLFFAVLTLLAGPEGIPLPRRIFSPSSWIVASMAGLYALCLHLFFPAYLSRVAPIVYLTYPYIYLPLGAKIAKGIALASVGVLLILGFIRPWRSRIAWLGFVGAGFIAYCLNAGWTYTLYLLFAPLTLVCFRIFESPRNLKTWAMRGFAGLLLAVSAGLLACSGWSLMRDITYTARDGYGRSYAHLRPGFYQQLRTAAGDNFILLSTTLWGMNIDVLNGRPHSVFPYDSLWTLPWLKDHPTAPQAGYVRHELFEPLAQALETYPDATVMVDTSPERWTIPPSMDLLAFFKTDEKIRDLLQVYHPVETLDDCAEKHDHELENTMCRYVVWKKN